MRGGSSLPAKGAAATATPDLTPCPFPLRSRLPGPDHWGANIIALPGGSAFPIQRETTHPT